MQPKLFKIAQIENPQRLLLTHTLTVPSLHDDQSIVCDVVHVCAKLIKIWNLSNTTEKRSQYDRCCMKFLDREPTALFKSSHPVFMCLIYLFIGNQRLHRCRVFGIYCVYGTTIFSKSILEDAENKVKNSIKTIYRRFYDHSKKCHTRSTYYENKKITTHTKKRNPAKSFKSWRSTATTTRGKI